MSEQLDRIEKLLTLSIKNVLNTRECAILLGISEGRVRHLASERKLPHYKRGTKTYFSKSEVEQWMLEKRIPTDEEINEYVELNYERQ